MHMPTPPFLSSFPNAIPRGKLIEYAYTSDEKFYLIAKGGEGRGGEVDNLQCDSDTQLFIKYVHHKIQICAGNDSIMSWETTSKLIVEE